MQVRKIHRRKYSWVNSVEVSGHIVPSTGLPVTVHCIGAPRVALTGIWSNGQVYAFQRGFGGQSGLWLSARTPYKRHVATL